MNFGRSTLLLAVLVGGLLTAEGTGARNAIHANANDVVGTWRQVSATYGGKPAARAEGAIFLLHLTPTQFVQVGITKDKIAGLVAGGTYALSGDELRETIEYTTSGEAAEKIKGETFTYHCKLEGKRMTLTGTILEVDCEEVWERDEAK